MELNTVIAGLIGAGAAQISQQIFTHLNNKQAFLREKAKIFYHNKLSKGEIMLGLYVGIASNIYTAIPILNQIILHVKGEITVDERDAEGIEDTFKLACDNIELLNNRATNEANSAYLYYDIKQQITEDRGNNFMLLCYTLRSKKEAYINSEINSTENLLVHLIQLSNFLTDMKNEIENIITQIKVQAIK